MKSHKTCFYTFLHDNKEKAWELVFSPRGKISRGIFRPGAFFGISRPGAKFSGCPRPGAKIFGEFPSRKVIYYYVIVGGNFRFSLKITIALKASSDKRLRCFVFDETIHIEGPL